MEISILVSRSLFPVHPLCAGECILHFREEASAPPVSFQWYLMLYSLFQQYTASVYAISSWKTIKALELAEFCCQQALPGSYNFSIMLLNFLASGDVISIVYSIIALLASVFFVVVGVWYYVRHRHQQIQRLDQMDKARSFVVFRHDPLH